ncbi:hypothetical protein HDU98_003365, partial [Podochytrium sp. JEL0797]
EQNSIDKKDPESHFLTAAFTESNDLPMMETSIRSNKFHRTFLAVLLATILVLSVALGFLLSHPSSSDALQAGQNITFAGVSHFKQHDATTNSCSDVPDNSVICTSLTTFTICMGGANTPIQNVAPGTDCCNGQLVGAGACASSDSQSAPTADAQKPTAPPTQAPQPSTVAFQTPQAPVPAPESIPQTIAPVPAPASLPVTTTKASSNGGGSASPANILISGSGHGSYYYDITGAGCSSQPALASALVTEAGGYTSCEPSTGYKTLAARGDNHIVALALDQMNANKAGLCGKQVVVKYNGQVVQGNFVVWDSCEACTGGVRLDFSLGELLGINADACALGIVPGISWEVTDVQVIPYVG